MPAFEALTVRFSRYSDSWQSWQTAFGQQSSQLDSTYVGANNPRGPAQVTLSGTPLTVGCHKEQVLHSLHMV